MSKVSAETQSLIDAVNILQQAKRDAVNEPMPIFSFVHHAQRYVETLLSEHLFSNYQES
jgi:hypothetical protein